MSKPEKKLEIRQMIQTVQAIVKLVSLKSKLSNKNLKIFSGLKISANG